MYVRMMRTIWYQLNAYIYVIILYYFKSGLDTYTCTYYVYVIKLVYVTEFAKRGLIHAFDFPTLTSHNFICK